MKEESLSLGEFLKITWYWIPNKIRFLFNLLIRIISVTGGFISAYFLGKAIDSLVAGTNFNSFIWFVLIIAGIELTTVFTRFYSKFYIQYTGAQMAQRLRREGFKKLMRLNMSWHESQQTGKKLSQIEKGASATSELMRMFSNEIIQLIVSGAVVLFVFFKINLLYLIVILTFAIVIFLSERFFVKKVYAASKRYHIYEEKVGGLLFEAGNNLLSIKALGYEDKILRLIKNKEKNSLLNWTKRKVEGQKKSVTVLVLTVLGYAAFFTLLGRDAISGAISVGSVVVFLGYYTRFSSAMTNYASVSLGFVALKVRFERLNVLINEPEENEDLHGKKHLSKNWKKIIFENVDFAYKDKKVLKKFSLQINRNEKIGIVGLSGSGKSTIAKLLLKLYEPQSGRVCFDDRNVKEINKKSLREGLSVVLQDQELFSTTLQENITMAGVGSDTSRLNQAIHVSYLKPVIDELPFGIKTQIGEKGFKLSGGQRQRLGIARAVYRNTPVIILDEATSSLDSASEYHIQKSFDDLGNTTLIVIAHRLATLKGMDRIVYLEHGVIKEEGSFRSLIAKKGKFYELYQKQRLKEV
ncbi:ABC transporter ATP-binding protein [Candidatus Woesearchaeota archaeon]|nr:ABC transporter ATP-binding protein [Candidatus Woesearchaeota archaeon]